MECAEIRSRFVAGRVPAGPEVDAHLAGCPECRELFEQGAALGRRLAQGVAPEPDASELLARVEAELQAERGLRARLRALPSSVRAGLLVGVALLLGVSQLALRRRPDFSEFSPTVFWGVVVLLGLVLSIGAWRLTLGPIAPLRSDRSQRRVALALLLAPALIVLLVPLGSASPEFAASWGSPQSCFSYGAALVAPLVLLYWLLERRDRVPTVVLVSAGALAGIAANLLLHAHCPSAHLGHLLLGHASIGVAWALVLGLLSKPLQRAR